MKPPAHPPPNDIFILNNFPGEILPLCLQIMQLGQGRASDTHLGKKSGSSWCWSEKNNIIFASVIQGRWKDMRAVGLHGTNRGRWRFQMAALSSTSHFCQGGRKRERKRSLRSVVINRSATQGSLSSVFYLEGRQHSGYAERRGLQNVCFETEILPW